MTTKNAVALRAFTHAGDSFAKDQLYEIDEGHFADWSAKGVDLVREATAEDMPPRDRAEPAPTLLAAETAAA